MTAPALEDEYGLPLASAHQLTDLQGTYGGLTFWNLAPVDQPTIDRHVNRSHEGLGILPPVTDAADAEFVWLVDDHGRFAYALVNTATHDLVELEPTPRDLRVRCALQYRTQGAPA